MKALKLAVAEPSAILRCGIIAVLRRLPAPDVDILEIADISQLTVQLSRHRPDVLVVNPLAAWSADQVEDWLRDHQLPRHPLVEQGYPSIGCWPCTRAVEAGENARDGRWSGQEKTECGIHGRVLAPAC